MTLLSLVTVLLIGGAVGVLPGLFGVGGSFITVPALSQLAGVPIDVAIGTAACQVLGPSTSGLMHRHRGGQLRWQLPLTMLGGMLMGIWLGMQFLDWAKGSDQTWQVQGRDVPRFDAIMLSCYLLLLLSLAVIVAVDWHQRRRPDSGDRRGWLEGWRLQPLGNFPEIDGRGFSIPILSILGIAVGFLTGGMGMGGGIVVMPALVTLVGLRTQQAINVALVLTWLGGIFATTGHALAGRVDLKLVCLLLVGGAIGGKYGSQLGERLGGQRLRGYFALLILVVAVLMGFKLAKLFGLV